MDHLAILQEPYFSLIISGKKTIESRWYLTKRAPWNKMRQGEIIYLKPSSKPVLAKCVVKTVHQFDDLTPLKVKKIIADFPGVAFVNKEKAFEHNKFKKYCILIEFQDLEMIMPFDIDKSGFGNQSAWICVDSITALKRI
jgi:ASC-1-like (ASCH) protein